MKWIGCIAYGCFIAVTGSIQAATYGGGSGMTGDPYQIWTAEQLNQIGHNIADYGKSFILKADMDLEGYDGLEGRPALNIIAPDANPQQAEYQGTPFSGMFNGNGHTISNLTLVQPLGDYIGLFGKLGINGTVRNLGLINVHIEGHDCVGGLAGFNQGTISGCFTTGIILADGIYTGGLAGWNQNGCTISNCYSTCTVTGNQIVGGLVGYNGDDAVISNCFSAGKVTASSGVGGLVGVNFYFDDDPGGGDDGDSPIYLPPPTIHTGIVSNSFWDVQASGLTYSAGGWGISHAQMRQASFYSDAGWDFVNTWTMCDTITYPLLRWQVPANYVCTGISGTIRMADGTPIVGVKVTVNPPGGWAITDQTGFYAVDVPNGWTGTVLLAKEGYIFEPAARSYSSLIRVEVNQNYSGMGYGGGNGSEQKPFLIYTSEHMNAIGANADEWDKRFSLMTDIDMAAFAGQPHKSIGNSHKYFTGSFDGNGHSILHFTVKGADDLGLFHSIGGSGSVHSLHLIDIAIEGSTNVGGLAVYNAGSISNCFLTGRVSGFDNVGGLVSHNSGTVFDCNAIVEVTASGNSIGGLGADNLGTITNSVASGSVSGNACIGGLLGMNSGYVLECYSVAGATGTGGQIGGLVGCHQSGEIRNCYAMGPVFGNERVGGLVGNVSGGRVLKCYSTGTVDSGSTSGGLVGTSENGDVLMSYWDLETSGQTVSSGGNGRSTDQMKQAATFIGWNRCGDTIWTLDEGNDYPRLFWEEKPGIPLDTFLPGSGIPSDPFLIGTPEELILVKITPCDWDKCFRLMADLDLSDYANFRFYGIGTDESQPFCGVFDGNGHTISNLTCSSSSDHIGLFGAVGPTGIVQNVGMLNVDLRGDDNIGALTGWNRGTITTCYATGSVSGDRDIGGLIGDNDYGTVTHCHASVAVAGQGAVGGLIGENGEPSKECTVSECSATGTVSGSYNVGGLVGRNRSGMIANCYATGTTSGNSSIGGLVGNLSKSTISRCFSAGGVLGDTNVGGLVGYSDNGTVLDSLWDSQASGQTTSAGGIGKTTAEMQQRQLFTSAQWDFLDESANGTEDVWRMCKDGILYPQLVSELARRGDWECPDGVGFKELSYLAGRWLAEGQEACGRADINGDGTVGMDDFAILSYNWHIGIPVSFLDGLIARWTMDDNAANKIAQDDSGNNLVGTSQRNTSVLTTAGKFGTALAFNGTSDWIDCGTNVTLLPDVWTLCAWVKCTDTTTPMLISFGGNYPSIKLQNNAKGKPLIHLGQYNYRYFAAAAWATLKDGQWHHVAFTVPGKEQANVNQAWMYLDGVAVAGDPACVTGLQANKIHVYLGANPSGAAQRFGGAMDDLMLFNRVLDEAEIRQAMNWKP